MKKRGLHVVLLYLVLWVTAFVYFLFRFPRNTGSLSEYLSFFLDLASRKFVLIGFHILFVLVCALYLIISHFLRVAKKREAGLHGNSFRFGFSFPYLLWWPVLKRSST